MRRLFSGVLIEHVSQRLAKQDGALAVDVQDLACELRVLGHSSLRCSRKKVPARGVVFDKRRQTFPNSAQRQGTRKTAGNPAVANGSF